MGSTSVHRIAESLREEILAGAIGLGAPLREEHLAARFSVSRHTVRTALAQLTGTGMVQSTPFQGVRVTNFDSAQAVALQDLRRALESEAVDMLFRRHGAARWPVAVTRPIEQAIERLVEAEGADDGIGVLRAHAAVHLAIVAAAESPRVRRAHEQLSDELHLLLLEARPHYEPGELGPQHRMLLDEIQRQGANPIRRHLSDTLRRLDQ